MVDRIDKDKFNKTDDQEDLDEYNRGIDRALGIPPRMGMPGPSRDPWRGRSEHMKCRSCMSYAPKTDKVGRCRHNAPTMDGFPVVFPDDDWCRRHKIDEAYIEYQSAQEEKDRAIGAMNTIDR